MVIQSNYICVISWHLLFILTTKLRTHTYVLASVTLTVTGKSLTAISHKVVICQRADNPSTSIASECNAVFLQIEGA